MGKKLKVRFKTIKGSKTETKELKINDEISKLKEVVFLPTFYNEKTTEERNKILAQFIDDLPIRITALGYYDITEEYGGVAYRIASRGMTAEFSRGYLRTDEQRVQLLALIDALQHVIGHGDLEICIESDEIFKALSFGDALSWKENNWKDNKGEMIKNWDLWQKLLDLLSRNHKVSLSFLLEPDEKNHLLDLANNIARLIFFTDFRYTGYLENDDF